jgi:2-polyprenyl-3-methyl-5-hydroxy-6-metoxy-1,4-benzoquinol methylase
MSVEGAGHMNATPHCPICAQARASHFATAQDIEYFTTPEDFTFYRCADCDVLFLHPMPSDRLSEIYPSNYYSFHVDSGRSIAQRIKQFLDDRTFAALTRDVEGSSLAALDVGGGSGWLLNDLKRAEPRVNRTTVVDIDPRAEQIARANGHDYHRTTFEQFSTNERFDIILMLNLIEHVTDPVAVLRKAKELLRPGGRIWIKTPNYDALDARIFKNRSWGGFHTPISSCSRKTASSAIALPPASRWRTAHTHKARRSGRSVWSTNCERLGFALSHHRGHRSKMR